MYPTNPTTRSDRRSRLTLAGAGLLAAAVLVVGCAMTAADDTAEQLTAPSTSPVSDTLRVSDTLPRTPFHHYSRP